MTDQATRYDRMAAGYDRWWAPVLAPSAQALLDRLAPVVQAGATEILDVGIGTGNLAFPALGRWPGVTVTGGPITLAPGASDGVTFTAAYTLTQADLNARFKSNTAIARVLGVGLARLGAVRRIDDIEKALRASLMEIIPHLEKRTHYLATFANLATLLGLLGTVSGLIGAFSAVATANPAETATCSRASARPRSPSPKSSATIAWPAASSIAEPTPWTPRAATSHQTPGAKPPRAEPSVKVTNPARNTGFVPQMSAARPDVTTSPTMASR